jgi:hypothetical protein
MVGALNRRRSPTVAAARADLQALTRHRHF